MGTRRARACSSIVVTCRRVFGVHADKVVDIATCFSGITRTRCVAIGLGYATTWRGVEDYGRFVSKLPMGQHEDRKGLNWFRNSSC